MHFLLFIFILLVVEVVKALNIATCSPDNVERVLLKTNSEVDIIITDGKVKEEFMPFQYTCGGKTILSRRQATFRECTRSTHTHHLHFSSFSLLLAPFQLPLSTSVSVPSVYTVHGPYIRVLYGVPATTNRRRLAETGGACRDLGILWEPRYSFADVVSQEGDRLRFLMLSNIDGFDLVSSELVNYNDKEDYGVWDQVLRGFEEPLTQTFKPISIGFEESTTKQMDISASKRNVDIEIVQSTQSGLCKLLVANEEKEEEEEKWLSLKLSNGMELKSWECNMSRTDFKDPFSAKQLMNLSAIIKAPYSTELLHLYVTVHNPFTLHMSKYFPLEDKHFKYKSLTVVLPKTPEVAHEVRQFEDRVINQHLPLLTPVPRFESSRSKDVFVFALKSTWHRVRYNNIDDTFQVSLLTKEQKTKEQNSEQRTRKVLHQKEEDYSLVYILSFLLIILVIVSVVWFWRMSNKN